MHKNTICNINRVEYLLPGVKMQCSNTISAHTKFQIKRHKNASKQNLAYSRNMMQVEFIRQLG